MDGADGVIGFWCAMMTGGGGQFCESMMVGLLGETQILCSQ